jgi:protein-L-isoaspartate(D-aspartate) O-methyltransferase
VSLSFVFRKARRTRSYRALMAVALACAEPRHTPQRVETEVAAARAPNAPPAAGQGRSAAFEQASLEHRATRERMVEEQLVKRGITDRQVLDAMRRVPRHRFVPPKLELAAYQDGPLPIVGGQTISQPYIVAFMTEACRAPRAKRCLEIGTGSGYQAAVLAELCGETYSIEYLADVAEFGRRNLEALGYLERAVHLRVGDGYAGWPERAPFDAIVVTAAPERVPAPLLEQLAIEGRLVIPVGGERSQQLEVWTRLGPGNDPSAFSRERSFGVRFVPFLGPGSK